MVIIIRSADYVLWDCHAEPFEGSVRNDGLPHHFISNSSVTS
ncbi:MAG: hypothetical protein ACI4MS_00750 [Candidatus Coproplasma sp.]